MTLDGFVYLAPLLMLAVIALLGFVGCDVVLGLDRLSIPPGPSFVGATGSDGRVDLTWEAYEGATKYTIRRRTDVDPQTVIASPEADATSYTDTDVVNEITYYYEVTATKTGVESQPTAEVRATPSATGANYYVTGVTLGSTQNQVTSFRGMAIRIGQSPIVVRALGRGFAAGNTGAHLIKIVNGTTGADIPNASVTVTMTPSTPGTFQYGALLSPVTLDPGELYFVVSRETAGGDLVYRQDTVVTTTAVAVLEGPAFTMTLTGAYTTVQSPGNTIGPVDFQY